MKFKIRLIPILLLVILVLTACASSRQYVSSPGELTNIIFKALKTNDQATFDNLVVTRDDAIQMLEYYLNRDGTDNKNVSFRKTRAKRRLHGLKSISNKEFHKYMSHIRASLTKIIKAAKKDGVNFQQAKFIRIAGIKGRQQTGTTKYDIRFVISYNNNEYEIWIDDAIKTAKGIKLYDDMKWVGKIEKGSKGSSHTRTLEFLKSLGNSKQK